MLGNSVVCSASPCCRLWCRDVAEHVYMYQCVWTATVYLFFATVCQVSSAHFMPESLPWLPGLVMHVASPHIVCARAMTLYVVKLQAT